MNNEIYKKHVYDLDLTSLLLNYEKGIGQVKLKNTDKPPEYYIDQIKFSIDEYCHNNGIVFDNEVILLISPEANNIYSYFLDIIMRWAEDKGVPKERVKQIVKGVPAEKLIWENNKNTILKKLSNELFLKEYTKRKTDFQDVFLNNKRIDWKGSPESWVYLMYSLTRSPYAYMTTSKGVKPYLIISRQFFKFYNDEEKKYEKGALSTMLHNITKRSAGKHGKTTSDIDSILKRLIINF